MSEGENADGKLLTIAIAAYNAERTLRRTLDSVIPGPANSDAYDSVIADPAVSDAADSGSDMNGRPASCTGTAEDALIRSVEILIIDDGSSDSTRGIASEYEKRFPDIVRVISKENGGYGSAVNTAVREARGIYFKLLDADDAFDREGLQELIAFISEAYRQSRLSGQDAMADAASCDAKCAGPGTSSGEAEFSRSAADSRNAKRGSSDDSSVDTESAGSSDDSFEAECECGGRPLHMPDLVLTPFIYERLMEGGGSIRELADRHGIREEDEPVRIAWIEDSGLSEGLMMFEICVRTDVIRRSGVHLTEHCYYTDNEYVMAVLLYSKSVAILPHPVYIYSLGVPGQSMSIEGRRLHTEDKVRAALGVIGIYEDYLSSDSDVNMNEQSVLRGTGKVLADILISTMVREIYVAYMVKEDPERFRSGLRKLDADLKKEHPGAWKTAGRSRLVRTARHCGPAAYRMLCRKLLKDETGRTGPVSMAEEHTASSGLITEGEDRSGRIGSITERKEHTGSAGLITEREDRSGNRRISGIQTAAEYLTALCMIVQCRTVYMHLRDWGMIVNRGIWAVMLAALAVCICTSVMASIAETDIIPDRGSIYRRICYTVIAFCIYIGIFITADPVNYLRVIRCAAAVIMMIILTSLPGGREEGRRILLCFSDIMMIIAGVSLLCWLFGSVLHILPGTGFVQIDWSPTGRYVSRPTFIGIYFETQWTGWEAIPARNSGIFTEAPMAGFCTSMALLIEICLRERKCSMIEQRSCRSRNADTLKKAKIILAVIMIITTFSVISYIFLALLAFAEILARREMIGQRIAGRSRPFRIIARVSACAAAVVAICAGIYLIRNKFLHGSGYVRLNDFEVGFRGWMAHPLFGGGFESLEYLQGFMPEWRIGYDVGFSNSPMEILAQGGIYIGALYIYAFIASLVRAVRGRSRRITEFIILFGYMFIFTVVHYQYITFFVLIFALAASGQSRKENA